MGPETTSKRPAKSAIQVASSFPSLPSLSAPELHAQFDESAKLEESIKANLRGLGYGD